MKTKSGPRPATAVERSENAKLGDCSATYVSRASCPADCPVYDECYASPRQAHGFVGFTTARLEESDETHPEALARVEAAGIATLSGLRPLRLHVVGDATTREAVLVLARAARQYRLQGLRTRTAQVRLLGGSPTAIQPPPVWTYTHAWRTIRRHWWGDGVSVLASCESVADVKAAWARGYAAAIIVPEQSSEKTYPLADGVRAVPCPYETRGTTCDKCGLCWQDRTLYDRGLVIAFAAKGVRKQQLRRKLIALQTVEA